MSVPIKIECPKCHADRTLLDSCFAMAAYIAPGGSTEPASGGPRGSVNTDCALPVRLVLCPRCHLLEMYHDVGLECLG